MHIFITAGCRARLCPINIMSFLSFQNVQTL